MAAAATAAAQAAAILTHPLMNDHMTNVLGITSQPLRGRLIIAGFTDDIDRLSTRPGSFAIKACSGVRKSGGLPATLMSVEIEEDLINLVRWVRYTYIVTRPLAWADATVADTRALGQWLDQLPPEADAQGPGKFKSIANFRELNDNLIQYLSVARSSAGFPLSHLIRAAGPPPADQGFGLPSFDEELATRGRLDGIYYAASNKKLWNVIRDMCHETPAWTHVQPFARRFDGRRAHLALISTYMGQDIQYTLRSTAESFDLQV